MDPAAEGDEAKWTGGERRVPMWVALAAAPLSSPAQSLVPTTGDGEQTPVTSTVTFTVILLGVGSAQASRHLR
eukprot:5985393-Prymnesium_polylepis.1